ncbi:MAG: calcium/sodium antiporter [Paludibacteraceae bacterium]|nr:calcium/sodium antiporter [Paludibacteraceae bacterium]
MIESLLSYGWWVAVILIIVGFIALVKGADWLVDGASAVAKRSGVSDLVIGLTVVAFGTSMPEFVVNMVSVGHGTTELAITNILGSNIINTFVILGLTALVYPIASRRSTRNFDIPMSFLGCVGVYYAATLPHVLGRTTACIDRYCGAALLVFFIYFLYTTFRNARAHQGETIEEEHSPASAQGGETTLGKAILLILAGLAGLVIGGELIVDSAVDIATRLGVSEAVIGLTVVALGTSLPELATSVMAAFKKNCDLAIGNVIGSNIFNIFFILGTSALIRPLPAYRGLEIDAFMAALGSLIIWLALKSRREHKIGRITGIILLIVYAGYLAYRLMYNVQ